MIAVVDPEKCIRGGCSACLIVKACDIRAIVRLDEDDPAYVDQALCNGCAECLFACPHQAVALGEP